MNKADLERLTGELVTPLLKERGLELVGVKFSQGKLWRLTVYVDNPEGVTTDDCEWVSERLSVLLDEKDPVPGRYLLEVSSAGLERPLFNEADFVRFSGKRVEVHSFSVIKGRRKFVGKLGGLADNSVRIHDEETDEEVMVPLAGIAKANLKPDLDELFGRQPARRRGKQ